MDFICDPAFEATSVPVGDLALCHVRLQRDARFVWLILLPRQPRLVELDDLDVGARARLMEEVVLAGEAVRYVAKGEDRAVDKLNIAALGNVTAQLHVHVIGRRRDDGLWPDPVWGRGHPEVLDAKRLEGRLAMLRTAFGEALSCAGSASR